MTTETTLPDYLSQGLDIVFVGINPGAYSASVGKYFANPQNRFWRALNLSGLLNPNLQLELAPGDEARLAPHGLGFTDVVKRPTNNASSLRSADFRQWAPKTRAKLLHASPLIVCFNGLTAYKWFRQYSDPAPPASSPSPQHSPAQPDAAPPAQPTHAHPAQPDAAPPAPPPRTPPPAAPPLWKSARLGEQPEPLGRSRVFVAPSPSPANASYSLDDIAGWLRRLAALRDSLKTHANA